MWKRIINCLIATVYLATIMSFGMFIPTRVTDYEIAKVETTESAKATAEVETVTIVAKPKMQNNQMDLTPLVTNAQPDAEETTEEVVEEFVEVEEEPAEVEEETVEVTEKVEVADEPEVVDETEADVESYDYDLSDIDLLARITYLEAGGTSYECQCAVASVVVNRANRGGKSLYDVIYAPGQFTPAYLVSSTTPTQSCIDAATQVLSGGITIPSNVIYFRAGYYFDWAEPYTNMDNVYFSYG